MDWDFNINIFTTLIWEMIYSTKDSSKYIDCESWYASPYLSFFLGGKKKMKLKKTNTICHNHTIYKNIKHTHSKTVQLVDQGTLFSNLQTVLFKPPSDAVDIVFSFSGSADVCENTIKADWKLNHCTSVLCLEPVTVIQGMTKVHPSVAKWNL